VQLGEELLAERGWPTFMQSLPRLIESMLEIFHRESGIRLQNLGRFDSGLLLLRTSSRTFSEMQMPPGSARF
jgi:hypothetical protein